MIAGEMQESTSNGRGSPSDSKRAIVFNVHGIGKPVRSLEPGEESTWVTIGQFEMVLDAIVGRPDVRVTFDDGNRSDIEIGLPRLLERGLTAEFFVLAGLLGRPGRLDQSDVGDLLGAGMQIGSHGWAHRDWRTLNHLQADEELRQAPRVLSAIVGTPITHVAIPFGSYDRNVLRRLRQSGATRAYTSDGGRALPGAWLQPRNSLRSNIGPEWVRDVLDGRPSLRKRGRRMLARAAKRVR